MNRRADDESGGDELESNDAAGGDPTLDDPSGGDAASATSGEDGPPALAFFEGDVTDNDLVIPLDETDVICWVPSPKPPVVAALEAGRAPAHR